MAVIDLYPERLSGYRLGWTVAGLSGLRKGMDGLPSKSQSSRCRGCGRVVGSVAVLAVAVTSTAALARAEPVRLVVVWLDCDRCCGCCRAVVMVYAGLSPGVVVVVLVRVLAGYWQAAAVVCRSVGRVAAVDAARVRASTGGGVVDEQSAGLS